jgi:hypothetical protein
MRYFLGILMFFLAFGWLILFFSATGLFYTETIVLSIIFSAILVLKLSFRNVLKINLSKGVLLASLAVSLATCHFATPTILGGRDQGSIATAAIYLSQNHNLEIKSPIAQDLFQKYGPGKSLNFPGFDYQKNGSLLSRFPVAYTAYLASFFDLFGLKGIQYANLVPLFFFLVIFWLILREFFDKKVSFFGYLVAATFFPFLWFSKYALTETYTLFLVWTGVYFLIRLFKDPASGESRDLILAYIPLAFFALSALTRIEGMIFFLLSVIYILILQKKGILHKPKNFEKNLLVSILLLSILYVFLSFPALLDSARNFAKAFLPNSTKESAPSANLYAYLIRIFLSYNILAYLILGFAGIGWLAMKFKKNWLKPEFIPFFITFPAFFYLFSPMITLDDPWLLRRFVFAVFPALIFYSVYTLQKFFYHKIFLYFTLTVLIAANSVVSWRFFTLSENKELLPQIEKISQKFGTDDLILVDRLASGSGYSLLSEPLRTIFGKNAVYFFNAEDLSYINQNRYKNIYLIGSLEEENPWYRELVKNKMPQSFEVVVNNFLEPPEKKWALAQNIEAKSLVGIWKIK